MLTNDQMDELFRRTEKTEGYRLTVDLEQQIVTDDQGLRYSFTVDPFRRDCLLKGLDDIGLTLVHADEIAAFEKNGVRSPVMYQPVDVRFHHETAPQKN
jgi:3-isopropylmalate/(R)-2-methylmalate dehydratase small subunit